MLRALARRLTAAETLTSLLSGSRAFAVLYGWSMDS